MIIINADDLGRSVAETNAALECYRTNAITSTTAMMFMRESPRAAQAATELGMDVGLHLNLSDCFTAGNVGEPLRRSQERVSRFLCSTKYAVLVYHPFLRRDFAGVIDAQLEEFVRLFGKRPSHIDGHRHHHLCANVLLDGLIPPGYRVRRSFSFWPGEKSIINRSYRRCVDRALKRKHVVTDYFFSLRQCLAFDRMTRVFALASTATIELMAHPVNAVEQQYLAGTAYRAALAKLTRGDYSHLSVVPPGPRTPGRAPQSSSPLERTVRL